MNLHHKGHKSREGEASTLIYLDYSATDYRDVDLHALMVAKIHITDTIYVGCLGTLGPLPNNDLMGYQGPTPDLSG